MKTISTLILGMSISFGFCQAPTTPASTPPVYDAAKVISIYSNAYASGAGATNFTANWGQSTVFSKITVTGAAVGDSIIEMANFNYQGFELGKDIDVSSMLYLHIDVWTADETAFQIVPIEKGDAKEVAYIPTLTLNSWNSIDIPLTYFVNAGINVSDIFQFKFVGSGNTPPATKKTVYIDNLYFYNNSIIVDNTPPTAFTATKGAVTPFSIALILNATDDSGIIKYAITYGKTTVNSSGKSAVADTVVISGLTSATSYDFSVAATDPTGNIAANSPIAITISTATQAAPNTSAPSPTALAANVISIYSDAYTCGSGVTNYNSPWGQKTVFSKYTIVPGDTTLELANFDYQGFTLGTAVNASSMKYMHLDVWTADETTLQIFPICTTQTNGEQYFQPASLTLNSWNSIDIPLTYFTAKGLDMSSVFQIKLVGSGNTPPTPRKTVFIDNVYFYTIPLGIANVELSKAQMYPNPANNDLTVTLANSSLETNIEISNALGQAVYSSILSKGQNKIDINLNGLQSGIYFVKISNKDARVVRQLIKK